MIPCHLVNVDILFLLPIPVKKNAVYNHYAIVKQLMGNLPIIKLI